MSMKHPEKLHQAADKKRRLNRARKKQEDRERRLRLDAERAAKAAGTAKSA